MKKLEDFETSLLDEYDVSCLDTLLLQLKNGGGDKPLGVSMADPEEYREKDDVKEWRENHDPIETFAAKLDDVDLDKLDEAVTARIDEAVEFAEASDFPTPESIYEHVYVLGGQVKDARG